jgi:hypothetical protein
MNNLGAEKWIDLGEWGKGMDGFRLPLSDELAGKLMVLYYVQGGQIITYLFDNLKSLTWKIIEGRDKGQTGTDNYKAIQITPDIYFVDFIKKDKPNESVSLVLNLTTAQATVITAVLPDIKSSGSSFIKRLGQGIDLSSIEVEFQKANINNPSNKSADFHPRTSDLIGKRVKYTYSDQHVYEHIYLNERIYTWHCLIGLEKGLADTEICDYLKIAPDIYLFVWREKILPTFGLVLIDFKEMRSNGKTFGLDLSTGKYINFTMGALAELLNITEYFPSK